MKRLLCLVLCLVSVLGLLSGCEQDKGTYVPTGDALVMDDGQTAGQSTETDTTPQELTLTWYPNITMNPLQCTDFTNRALFSLMYQGLFCVDREYQATPMLCKTYSVSKDMKTYTFYLENATFSDGTVLTPQDVVATYQAARKTTYYSGRFQHISGISETGDGGVSITLDTPMEDLPILLDIPILKAAEVQQDRPLGSGPYLLDASTENAVLRRVSNWWCNAKTLITAPAISLIQAESNPQIRDAFEFSGLNLVCANPGSDKYTDYRCDYELWDCENGVFLYLTCNMDSSIFSNPTVRSALPTAIDRDTIAADNYRGFARSATLPASPLSPNYSQVLAEKYAYDGGVAFQQAVADAGMVGKTLIFLVNSEDTMRVRIARTICKSLTDAGFVIDFRSVSGSTYEWTLKNRDYDLYLGQTRLSANMDLTPFFHTNGALSYGGINDVALYTLCLDALANHGNYYTLHQAVMDDGRLCPILFSSYAVYATRGLLTGLTPSRDNIFYYSMEKTMESAKLETE